MLSSTAVVEGRPVQKYLGIVTGEVIVGANPFRDLSASVRDIVGGRAGSYDEVLGSNGSMLMVSCSGTAVVL